MSDVHLPTDNVNFLKQWHLERNNGFNYDYVFVPGDFCRVPNSGTPIPEEQGGDGVRVESREKEMEAEAQIQAFLMNDMEGFADEVIYIPGNHDPSTMFSRDRSKLPVLSSNPAGNIHRGIFELRENLVVLGLGGCMQNHKQPKGQGPFEKCWSPFPYGDDAKYSFKDDLNELWQTARSQYLDENT